MVDSEPGKVVHTFKPSTQGQDDQEFNVWLLQVRLYLKKVETEKKHERENGAWIG